MKEYREMFKNKGIYPHLLLPEIIGISLSFLYIFSKNDIFEFYIAQIIIVAGIILSFLITILLNKKPYIQTTLSTIVVILFILLGLYIIKISYLFDKNVILVYFVAILLGDFTASKIGPKCKKYLLSPEISPNKTILGAITNVIVSILVSLFLTKELTIIQCVMFGIIISIFSQIGDLSISLIKRDLCLKHSGNLFNAYGGIFDRIDAFIFSAPIAYYFLLFSTH